MGPLVIVGCGYVGTRLARAALAEGRTVRALGRSMGRLEPLRELGAEVKYLDAGMPKQFSIALSGMRDATVVHSVPSTTGLPPGQALRATLQAAYAVGARCVILFSSAGLYGAHPDDEVWIDEDTPVVHDDPPMASILIDEREIDTTRFDQLRTVILRLTPVYGPGRGMRSSLRKGTFRILDDGQHATSRIHVDDVTRIVFAAEQLTALRSRFLVADDEPTTQGEYARWLCDRMGIPLPPSRQMFEPGAPAIAHRNRRIRNRLLKTTLGLELRYPSFRDGEAAIEAEEAGPRAR